MQMSSGASDQSGAENAASVTQSQPPDQALKKQATSRPLPLEKWLQKQREALREEREEERAEITAALAELSPQECQDKGLSLLYLSITGTNTSLYGRTSLSLGPSGAIRRDGTLPAHGFGVGDEVLLATMKGPHGGSRPQVTGVVSRVTASRVEFVASSEDVDDELLDVWSAAGGPMLRLDKLASEATHRKMMEALDALEKYRDGCAMRLVDFLFDRMQRPPPYVTAAPVPISAELNDQQKAAVALGLCTDDVAMIHGPPGTGKTTVVVELILQAVTRNLRLLVCAPSNVAVDNIVDRVAGARGPKTGPSPRIVRLGHPARLSPQILKYSLEALVDAADGTEIVRDARSELKGLEAKRPRDKVQRRAWRGELKALKREVRTREERVVQQIIKSRDIVLCTNVGAATRVLRDQEFDMVVIDEAAQALEASCWIPILKGRRLVLAGDHKQLAPTIKSRKAEKMGLAMTLFDRLMTLLGETRSQMLTVQYRMHKMICGWASQAMYQGLLEPDTSVADRTVSGLPYASAAGDMTDCPMLLLDTAGCGMEEVEGSAGGARGMTSASKSNEGEAKVVEAHVRALLSAGLRPEDIAVITPYNAQVELLRNVLSMDFPRLEIRSVDGFQGGEREAVVLSLVRSNRSREVGFLRDARRLNVAVTRARRHVCVVADSETVGSDEFLAGLLEYIEEHGEVRSPLEYLPDWTGADGGGGGPGGAVTEAMGRSTNVGKATRDKKSSGAKGGKQKPKSQPRPLSAVATSSPSTPVPAPEEDDAANGPDKTDADSEISDTEIVAMVIKFVLGQSMGPGVSRLELPPELSGRQRKVVHDLVEKLGARGVRHMSVGVGKKRRLVLEKGGQDAHGSGAERCDAQSPQPIVQEEASPPPLTSPQPSVPPAPRAVPAELSPPPAPTELPPSSTAPAATASQQPALAARRSSSSTKTTAKKSEGGATAPSAGLQLGGKTVGGADGAKVKPTNSVLGALHAERAARQRARPPSADAAAGEGDEGGAVTRGHMQGTSGSSKTKVKRGKKVSAAGGGGGSLDLDGAEDDFAAMGRAMEANARMTEVQNPIGDAHRARVYGWGRNPNRKEIAEKLTAKINESEEKRKPESKEEGGGAGGKGGGRRRGGR